MIHDHIIIGGGIVGLATALALQERQSGASILLLEKEETVAAHQTGHNSGVIHAGIYYEPGSLKATLCREGAQETKAFCAEHGIPVENCGKLIVATNAVEMERLAALEQRATANGIAHARLSQVELKEAEPAVTGLGALHIIETAIVDYRAVARAMADRIRAASGDLRCGVEVTAIAETDQAVTVTAGGETHVGKQLIACTGLQADRIVRMAGFEPDFSIVPFRGEYFTLPPSRAGLVKHLIYPAPDPDLPFLGIHLTRMIDGSITVGPNAVLSFAREGYAKGSIRPTDVLAMMRFPGFWRLARRNLRSGVFEMRNSIFRRHYLEQCRKYCPELTLADLGRPGAGIRAQAVTKDGVMVHDFLFKQSRRMLHVCNAPSPAATSAIPIGRTIVERLHD